MVDKKRVLYLYQQRQTTMKAIANKTIKSSKGIRITKGDTVELNYRENEYCDVAFNGESFTTTMGVANSYFTWIF